MLVGPFKYVAPRYYSPCATDLQRPKFILISYSKASLSLVKNGPRILWSMMLKVWNWPLIMSPSDHFMAAKVVFVVTFQFLFYFLAQVATKNRTLALIYGVLNSICYFGCFLVLRKPILLCCGYWLVFFYSSPRNYQYAVHYCSMSIRIRSPLIPKPLSWNTAQHKRLLRKKKKKKKKQKCRKLKQ